VYRRRTGSVPSPFRYLLVAIGVGVLGVAGFGVLVLYDEGPVAAWLLASIVLLPLFLVGVYLARTTALSRVDVLATTVMVWGVPFFLGVGVAMGVMTGLDSVLDLAPAESRRLGTAWIAAAVAGLVVTLSMITIGSRFGRELPGMTAARERV
jgi:hypothetical protein